MADRQIAAATISRIALNTLGRMACEYGHPFAVEHDHRECVVDDESYAADLILRLVFATTARDDDLILDRLADLTTAIAPE